MPITAPGQVQNALNLLLPIAEPVEENYTNLTNYVADNQQKIAESFNSVQTVHFARLLPTENNTKVFICTAYDGSFKDYIENFVTHLGWFFDGMLQYVDGGAALVPVENDPNKFNAFVAKNNVDTNLFSAYPTLTVVDILADEPSSGS